MLAQRRHTGGAPILTLATGAGCLDCSRIVALTACLLSACHATRHNERMLPPPWWVVLAPRQHEGARSFWHYLICAEYMHIAST